MNLNFIVFPAPKSSYSASNLGKELIWIPKYEALPLPSKPEGRRKSIKSSKGKKSRRPETSSVNSEQNSSNLENISELASYLNSPRNYKGAKAYPPEGYSAPSTARHKVVEEQYLGEHKTSFLHKGQLSDGGNNKEKLKKINSVLNNYGEAGRRFYFSDHQDLFGKGKATQPADNEPQKITEDVNLENLQTEVNFGPSNEEPKDPVPKNSKSKSADREQCEFLFDEINKDETCSIGHVQQHRAVQGDETIWSDGISHNYEPENNILANDFSIVHGSEKEHRMKVSCLQYLEGNSNVIHSDFSNHMGSRKKASVENNFSFIKTPKISQNMTSSCQEDLEARDEDLKRSSSPVKCDFSERLKTEGREDNFEDNFSKASPDRAFDIEEECDEGLTPNGKFVIKREIVKKSANLRISIMKQKTISFPTEKCASQDQAEELQITKKAINFLPRNLIACRHIPCLYMENLGGFDNIILFFHGNGEDLYHSYEILQFLKKSTKRSIVAMEYPGYGIYKSDRRPNACRIIEDSQILYDYLHKFLGVPEKKIILFGRSIGSGPATWLASRNNPGALVLMSPFTSIRGVVKDIAGKLAQYFVKERFNNMQNIRQIQCPALLIHGKKDKLISYRHSQILKENCPTACEEVYPDDMTHTDFDFEIDMGRPLNAFLARNGLNDMSLNSFQKSLPDSVYQKPCSF